LLQWVHRKLRQNNDDPMKDFTLVAIFTNSLISLKTPISGNPSTCLIVQPALQTKGSFSCINQPSFLSQESYSRFDYSIEEDKPQEETHAVISDIFKGFLTIGTLGAETVTNEPGTPTFCMPLENMHAEVTENELKLISYELEKFLVAEKEESYYESSKRNSNVSIATLSENLKLINGSEAEDYGNRSLCPLQDYLLGSSIELKEKREVRKERVSLSELFNRTKTTVTGDSTEVKKTHKSAIQIMKKMLKRVNGSSKSTNTSGDDAVFASTNKKLQKVGLYHYVFLLYL
ncbi:hypothetical protein Lal_00012718, partial [Lupinus albus]